MKIGFIGFGEVAYEFSKGLLEEGVKEITTYDIQIEHLIFGKLLTSRASELGIRLTNNLSEVVNLADILMVAVPANKALEVSKTLKPFLKKSQLYVELSASTPKTQSEIFETLKESQVNYVDASIMGPVPVYAHKVPILASGPGSKILIEKMQPYHMNITKINEHPGSASSVKLIRSIYMKGIASLLIETLKAADTYSVSELVLESISETFDNRSFIESMNRLVTGTAIHSERRAKELIGTIEMMEDKDLNHFMTDATKAKLEEITQSNIKEKLKGVKPENWKDVIQQL